MGIQRESCFPAVDEPGIPVSTVNHRRPAHQISKLNIGRFRGYDRAIRSVARWIVWRNLFSGMWYFAGHLNKKCENFECFLVWVSFNRASKFGASKTLGSSNYVISAASREKSSWNKD
jgi:hypothetical protein